MACYCGHQFYKTIHCGFSCAITGICWLLSLVWRVCAANNGLKCYVFLTLQIPIAKSSQHLTSIHLFSVYDSPVVLPMSSAYRQMTKKLYSHHFWNTVCLFVAILTPHGTRCRLDGTWQCSNYQDAFQLVLIVTAVRMPLLCSRQQLTIDRFLRSVNKLLAVPHKKTQL